MRRKSIEDRIRQRIAEEPETGGRPERAWQVHRRERAAELLAVATLQQQLADKARAEARDLADLLWHYDKQPTRSIETGAKPKEVRLPGLLGLFFSTTEQVPIVKDFWLVTVARQSVRREWETPFKSSEGPLYSYKHYPHGIALDPEGGLWTYRGPEMSESEYLRSGISAKRVPEVPDRLALTITGEATDVSIAPITEPSPGWTFPDTRADARPYTSVGAFMRALDTLGVELLRQDY